MRLLRRTGYLKRAFALIELIVVLVVVAILVALLLPALSRGRQRARDTQCLNNLRQLGIRMTLYLAEHERFPQSSPFVNSKWLSFGAEDNDAIFACPNIQGGLYRPNYFGSVGPEHRPNLGLALDRWTGEAVSASAIAAPAAMIAITDYFFWLIPPRVRQGGPDVPLPHRGGIQFLLVDGHVEHASSNRFAHPSTRPRWNRDNQPHDDTWNK
ncbi:MAG TPA: DUF1559 domain-containing protein [Methylomirabilota bacterium]|nr:DUF1559 domain-containing protein [Methylomirabilota bacterium]